MLNVWVYWEGNKPWWIEVCIKSIERCCRSATFNLLTADNVPDLPLHERWRELPPGVGTDCLRAALLATHGGLWLDADTICVQDPIQIVRWCKPEKFMYCVWSAAPERVVAGYVYSPAGHPIMMRWLDGVNSALKNSHVIGWGDIGEKMLTPIMQQSNQEMTWRFPREMFLPVDIDCNVQRYFEQSGWRDFATYYTLGFGLNHSWMMANKEKSMKPVPDGKMIQRLLYDTEKLNAEQTR